MKQNQKGFSAVELLIGIVFIGLIGAVGWLVYDRQNLKSSIEGNEQAVNSSDRTNNKQTGSDVREVNGYKFTVPKGWQVADSPFVSRKIGNGEYLLSPDYEAGDFPGFHVAKGAYLTFGDPPEMDKITDTMTTQDVLAKFRAGGDPYFNYEGATQETISGKQVISYEGGHQSFVKTFLYKMNSGEWTAIYFKPEVIAFSGLDKVPRYPEARQWVEEFIKLNP